MPLVVRCPGCNTQHQVQDALRGKSAKCRCGTVIQIPAGPAPAAAVQQAQPRPAGALAVQCPSCSKIHQADASLAGRMVRCTCGSPFQVPGGQPAANPVMAQANDPLGFGAPGGGMSDDLFGDMGAATASAPAMANYSAGHYAGAGAQQAANPYAPTRQAASPARKSTKKGTPGRCPKCGSGNFKTPFFTWWGGMV
jgi:hypothetical protein